MKKSFEDLTLYGRSKRLKQALDLLYSKTEDKSILEVAYNLYLSYIETKHEIYIYQCRNELVRVSRAYEFKEFHPYAINMLLD